MFQVVLELVIELSGFSEGQFLFSKW